MIIVNETTNETIIGRSFVVKWSYQPSGYWARTNFEGDTIWGRGLSKEDALSSLIENIEYINSGEGEESHDGWCDLG